MTRVVARRVGTLLGVTVAALLTLAGTANAHTELTGSDPADGSVVARSPAEVTLTFNEDVQDFFPTVVVTGPDGKSYAPDEPILAGNVITTAVDPLGPAGAYTVGYRVVSADDHPVEGQITFEYAPAPSSPAPSTQATSTPSTTTARTPTSSVAPPPLTTASAISPPPLTSPSVAPTAGSEEPEGTPGWVWPVVIGAVVLAGAVAALVASSRRGGTPAS